MTPFYLSEFSIEGEHGQTGISPFPTTEHSSSFPFPILFNNPQDYHSQQLHSKPIDFMLIGGESTDPTLNSNTTNISEKSSGDHSTGEEDCQETGKWMSSKMQMMRRMMINSDQTVATADNNPGTKNQDQQSQLNRNSCNSSSNYPLGGSIIRVCSDCSTTKTPLWRSGPHGPKSLCNACGIRQRKARRAIAAAAGGLVGAEKPTKRRSKVKAADVDRTVPFKKRCKMITAATSGTAKKKIDFTIRLSKNSALHHVFPQDERDAAILLMALSCGLICS